MAFKVVELRTFAILMIDYCSDKEDLDGRWLPSWMTHGHTVLCQKDPRKGNAAENYCRIKCLPLMWKLLAGFIAEDMYDYL